MLLHIKALLRKKFVFSFHSQSTVQKPVPKRKIPKGKRRKVALRKAADEKKRKVRLCLLPFSNFASKNFKEFL